jgi:hypothetical protein
MRLRARLWIGFAVACVMCGADPDQAIVTAMSSATSVGHVQVLRRAEVNPELDLVIAVGSLRRPPATYIQQRWEWSEETSLGLFLQSRDRPDVVYRVAVEKGPKDIDCAGRLERATATEVVISCTPEKGRFGPIRKFVYDSRAKALVKQLDYAPYEMARIFVSGERAVFIGTDDERLIAVEYDPARAPAFRVLKGAEEAQWTKRVPTSTGTVGLEMRREVYIDPRPFEDIHFGRGARFGLAKGEGETLLISERTGRGGARYLLPQSTYDDFASARPGRVSDGYGRAGTTIGEHIGPWQIDGERLWFGKTFYDGEGNTGVGGFGYFDSVEKKFRIYAPAEIAGWSVSAILVEPETVWLALASNGEYGTSAGGMIVFDRRTQQIEKFDVPDVATSIARVGEHLVLATAFGPAVLDQGQVRRYFVDETSDGRPYIAEAVAGGKAAASSSQNR